MKSLRLKNLILSAGFAAVTAVAAQLSLPVGAVPISLATLAVFCAGALLGARWGFVSQLIYILLGVVGVPVFAGFRGSAAVLLGPTGGFIIGYALAAFVVGAIVRARNDLLCLFVSVLAGWAVCALCGTAWYAVSTGTSAVQALYVCVLPFIPGDIAKIFAAVVISYKLIPIIRKLFAK